MGCNPCCCWRLKDGAVTVGIWSTIFCLIQLGIFGWQMAAIKYEKDRAADTLLPNYYEYGKYDVPSYYESYWQSPEERFYIGLFVIQIICLIASFFLLFASIALIYGAHTYSRLLVWPWFPCMLASIFSSLAYCIMWWTGDVRDYWLVLTILEMICVFLNLYCLVVVILFYRQMNAERDYYEKKQRRYDEYPDRYDELRKDNYYPQDQLPELEYPMQPGKGYSPPPPAAPRDEYTRLPQYYDPAAALPQKSPYRDRFASGGEDDMVSNWVKDQQLIGLVPEHANSEPASPTKEHFPVLPHSLSVPSMYAETSGASTCHHHCHRHHHHPHRSSSRHRSRPEDRDRRRGSSRRHGSRHRHRSASVGSYSRPSYSSDSSFTELSVEPRRRRRHSRGRDRYSDEEEEETDDSRGRRRHRKRHEKEDRDDRRKGPRQVKRDDRERDSKSLPTPAPTHEVASLPAEMPPAEVAAGPWPGAVGPQGGITIPQHIIIPPSGGQIGPDGRAQPHTYQINSEIRISYDQRGKPVGTTDSAGAPIAAPSQPQIASNATRSITGRPRAQPVSITSVV